MQKFLVGGTAYGSLPAIVDPTDGITPIAPSSIVCSTYKNGSTTATGDSVTINTALALGVGLYTWSYNPAGESEGDQWTLIFTVTIAGDPYYWREELIAYVVERGTDSASLASGVNVTQLGGDAQSLTDLKDFADAGYDPSTNKVQGVVLTDALTTYTGNTPQTGDSYAIVNNGTYGSAALKAILDIIAADTTTDIPALIATLQAFVDTEVAAIKAKTDNLPSDPADQSAVEAAITAATSPLATAANLALIPIDGTLTVTLANGVTHGGSTAMLRLGSSTTTPAFYVVNSSSDDNAHAVYFKAGSSMTGGAGLLIDGGSLQTTFIAPAVEGLYAGGDSVAHEGEITDIQSRLPAALESGRMPAALNTAGREAVADTVLSRNVSNVEATAGEHTLATAILGMLEWEISGNDLIIKRTDGTTVHYTKTLSSATGTGDVITGLN